MNDHSIIWNACYEWNIKKKIFSLAIENHYFEYPQLNFSLKLKHSQIQFISIVLWYLGVRVGVLESIFLKM